VDRLECVEHPDERVPPTLVEVESIAAANDPGPCGRGDADLVDRDRGARRRRITGPPAASRDGTVEQLSGQRVRESGDRDRGGVLRGCVMSLGL